MKITACGSVPTRTAPADHFTGYVLNTPIVEPEAPARVRAALVSFAPGARTNWHTHPLGQTLHVTSGAGLVQKWGEAVQAIRAGDTVWIPPGEKHWHGAGSETAMTHIAMHESLDGSHVEWLERVSDEQCGG